MQSQTFLRLHQDEQVLFRAVSIDKQYLLRTEGSRLYRFEFIGQEMQQPQTRPLPLNSYFTQHITSGKPLPIPGHRLRESSCKAYLRPVYMQLLRSSPLVRSSVAQVLCHHQQHIFLTLSKRPRKFIQVHLFQSPMNQMLPLTKNSNYSFTTNYLMEQSNFSIWAELVERLAYTATLDETIYFYALPSSNFIIHAQYNLSPCSNLGLIGQGRVLESDEESTQNGIIILVNQLREVVSLKGSIQLTQKRSCDVNDLFKQYICLYTNIRNPNLEQNEYYLLVKESQQSETLILRMQDGKVSEVEEQAAKKTSNKKAGKIEPFSKLQTSFKNVRNNYKDTLDRFGKITGIRHPSLINVGVCYQTGVDTRLQGLTIGVGPSESIFEWVSYHKYDDPAPAAIEKHLFGLPKQEQYLFFSEYQTAIPIQSRSPIVLDEDLFYKQRSLMTNRLRTQMPNLELTTARELEATYLGKLYNVHLYMPPSKSLENSQRYLVRGDYVFHHYLQDNFDDKGWGCAYRSFQTVLSWLIENGYTKPQKIPTHREIQTLLVQMNDKPASFIGQTEWIGSMEVTMLINQLTGIDSKMLHVANGPDIIDKLYEFRNHFLTQGTPIMFGGGVYAYTLLGIEFTSDKQCKFLILDPHYVASDNLKPILEKGGVSWRSVDMFLPRTFYNFCMPQVH